MSNIYDAGTAADAAAPRSAVAWPAIFAGSIAGAGISVILVLLGAGIGLASISPWGGGVSPVAFGVGAAIWLIVIEWVSAGFAGYLAGRLRTRMHAYHGDEVFFRDTAHGFVAWSFSLVILTAIFASSLAGILGKTADTAATVAAGVAQGAGSAAGGALSGGGDVNAYLTDRLFRSAPSTATAVTMTPAAPESAADAADVRAEGGRILLQSLAAGQISPDDRTYLAGLVAEQAGIPQAEAEQRVDAAMTDAQAAAAKAKEAADAARSAAAKASLFLALSLLVGAFIACVAAALGGRERDETEVRLAARA